MGSYCAPTPLLACPSWESNGCALRQHITNQYPDILADWTTCCSASHVPTNAFFSCNCYLFCNTTEVQAVTNCLGPALQALNPPVDISAIDFYCAPTAIYVAGGSENSSSTGTATATATISTGVGEVTETATEMATETATDTSTLMSNQVIGMAAMATSTTKAKASVGKSVSMGATLMVGCLLFGLLA